MAEPTATERGTDGADLAAAARDRGMEQLESAKAGLAEGAERIASAVERTADELEGDGDESLSGFGRSAASLMRQLAGGLRERDVETFARELAGLARRNPGLFLAGSVALGFGMARFFKARPSRSYSRGYGPEGAEWSDSRAPSAFDDDSRGSGADSGRVGLAERDYDPEDGLDLSASAQEGGEPNGSIQERAEDAAGRDEERARRRSARRAKPQRASPASAAEPGTEPPAADGLARGDSTDSAFTGGTGGGSMHGGKS
jgi:hypothetical protein